MGVQGKPTPLMEAEAVAALAVADLAGLHGLHAYVGGSVRRLRRTVSDVDLALVVPDGVESLELLPGWADGPAWHVTPKTATTTLGGVRVEVWWCPPDGIGPMMCFLTGPADLNVWMRRRALQQRMRLNQYTLRRLGGDRADWPEGDWDQHERQVFDLLDVSWMEPWERDDWRKHVESD